MAIADHIPRKNKFSKKYEDLIEDLLENHVDGAKDPKRFIYTNSNVFDFTITYTRWLTNNMSDKHGNLSMESQEMIKAK